MQLPFPLRQAIETQADRFNPRQLAEAAAQLSEKYRSPTRAVGPFMTTEVERLAYACVRMPATLAAVQHVLTELRERLPETSLRRLLDLGAGTGAASWAAEQTFAELERCTLIEQDAGLVRLGRELAHAAAAPALRQAEWRQANLLQVGEWPPHDLVICSYALGELAEGQVRQVARTAWAAAQQALVIVEPGTMRGFATILALRQELLAAGAHLLAPCPHAETCPLTATLEKDWCHFAARVERSALQRRLKAGSLGYEDEKFAYLILSREPAPRCAARVLRHPLHQPGRTQLSLCSAEGIRTVAVTKRDKELWKRARKVAWGDAWEEE